MTLSCHLVAAYHSLKVIKAFETIIIKNKRQENEELLLNGYRVSVWGNEKVLEIDSGDGCTTL